MKCPKGSLASNGARWVNKVFEKGFIDVEGEVAIAYRCPSCKKVDLVTQ